MSNLDFDVCHEIANVYFYFYHDDNIRSFTHTVDSSHFVILIYYNNSDSFDPYHELRIILDLILSYNLDSNGSSEKIILWTDKLTPFELFDNAAQNKKLTLFVDCIVKDFIIRFVLVKKHDCYEVHVVTPNENLDAEFQIKRKNALCKKYGDRFSYRKFILIEYRSLKKNYASRFVFRSTI